MKKYNLIALTNRISDTAHKRIVQELENRGIYGIVPSHGGILMLLFSGEKYTMKEIADRIHRTKPTVTVLVDKLIDYGYVKREKSPDDGRITYLLLTQKGLDLKPAFLAVSEKLNALVYKDLSDMEAEYLENMLEQIKQNLYLV